MFNICMIPFDVGWVDTPVAHNRWRVNKVVGSIPTGRVPVWLLSRNSGFLPQSKDLNTGFTGGSKWTLNRVSIVVALW